MKIYQMLTLGCLALGAAAGQADARPAVHSSTTVTKVHGPLKILPHHNRKICRTRRVHHHRTTRCWYH